MRRIALFLGPGVVSPAAILASDLGLAFVSASDLIREHAQRRTPQGMRIRNHIDAGELVPVELVTEVVAPVLSAAETGRMLSDYPRTVGQAELLAECGHEPEIMIELYVGEEDLDRHWWQAQQRPDILARMTAHENRAEPVRDHFRARGIYHLAHAGGADEDVVARLAAIVSSGNGTS
ncbi:nucleoside monophosphate kinase [Longispora urticae]